MTERHWNRRAGTLLFLVLAILVLAGITAAGIFLEEEAADQLRRIQQEER